MDLRTHVPTRSIYISYNVQRTSWSKEFFPTIPSVTDYKIKANNAKEKLIVTFVMVIISPPLTVPPVITCNHFK